MNKLSMSLAAMVISSVLTACSTNENAVESTLSISIPSVNPMVAQVLATDIDQLWSQDFDHYQQGLLKAVADEISIQALKGD
jgi:microbial collagenase